MQEKEHLLIKEPIVGEDVTINVGDNEKVRRRYTVKQVVQLVVTYIKETQFMKSDDWWSVWIGFIIFGTILPLVLVAHISMPTFNTWYSNPLLSFDGSTALKLVAFHYITVACLFIAFTCMGKSINASFITGFSFVFWLSIFSKVIGSNLILKTRGLGDSVWAILLGAFVTNVLRRIPEWLKPVVVTEFYIKISVVLLAVDLSLFKIIGLQGLITTWVDTPLLLITVFLIGYFVLRMTKDQAIIVSGGLSVCGSSAATAITSAIQGDKNTANLIIAIMSFFTIPLIPALPIFSSAVHIHPRVSGAWIGGSVDSTGAVIATASALGPIALETAAIVKMMQNILIGPICLLLTILWTRKFHPMVLYDRFPKFVIGFLVLSGVISTAIPYDLRAITQKNVFIISEWFSSFGFVCIGLELNMQKLLSDLAGHGWKFIILYLIGQTLDLLTTFGWAYVSFTFIRLHG